MGTPTPGPTAADVARLAGVSKATVSYVLSGRRSGASRISEQTRRRVLDAVADLGYVPNSVARALRRRATERVCLVVPRLGVPYLDLVAQDLQAVAADHGYALVILVADPRAQPPEQRSAAFTVRTVTEQLRRRFADGVVFAADTALTQAEASAVAKANIAVVAVSNDLRPDGFDVIRREVSDACRSAVAHLAARGHKRIGFIGHDLLPHQRDPRHDDYLAAMGDLGLPVDDRIVVAGASSRTAAYRSAEALLAAPQRPTAIFAASDVAAASAIWAARDAGLRVPADVAVVGVGNIPEDAITHPQLSSVGPREPASTAIADLLFSRLAADVLPPGRTHVEQWHLVVRGST